MLNTRPRGRPPKVDRKATARPLSAEAILEAISDGFFALNRDWQFIAFNRSAEEIFGLSRRDVLGRTIWEVSPGIVGTEFERRYRNVMATGAPEEFEQRSALRREQVHEIRAFAIAEGIALVFRDISERRRTEVRQATLLAELDHRVKNIFAVVSAIVQQTLKGAPNLDVGFSAISERLAALARAHAILTQDKWEEADVRELVATALEPYQLDRGNRLWAHGDQAKVGSQTALALAMVLQELATNAIKYGSLSNDSGKVELTWTKFSATVVRLVWRESGGPPVVAPTRQGFGTRLIGKALSAALEGRATIAFEAEGLVCTIEAAVSVSEL